MQAAPLRLLQPERRLWGKRGDGRQADSRPRGSGELGGGASPCPPSYHQLHPLPSPPLPPPGISQLIPLAAALRHLQGLKTATVQALTPGDPLTSPAPSLGRWRCPGAGWTPWAPPCVGVVSPPPVPGGSRVLRGPGCYLLVTPSPPAGAVGAEGG